MVQEVLKLRGFVTDGDGPAADRCGVDNVADDADVVKMVIMIGNIETLWICCCQPWAQATELCCGRRQDAMLPSGQGSQPSLYPIHRYRTYRCKLKLT